MIGFIFNAQRSNRRAGFTRHSGSQDRRCFRRTTLHTPSVEHDEKNHVQHDFNGQGIVVHKDLHDFIFLSLPIRNASVNVATVRTAFDTPGAGALLSLCSSEGWRKASVML